MAIEWARQVLQNALYTPLLLSCTDPWFPFPSPVHSHLAPPLAWSSMSVRMEPGR